MKPSASTVEITSVLLSIAILVYIQLLQLYSFNQWTIISRTSHSLAQENNSSQCLVDGFSHCTEPTVPQDFCCGPSTTCKLLAANTTVLFCPRDDKTYCFTIDPISCDVTQQNSTLHPDCPLKTTAVTMRLPACGSQCCPFGYSCNSYKTFALCLKNPNKQVLFPISGSESIHIFPRPSISEHMAIPPQTSSSESETKSTKHSISGGMLAAVIIVPLFAVIGAVVLAFWWIYRKKYMKEDSEHIVGRATSSKAKVDAPVVKDLWSRLEDPLELDTQGRTYELR